MTPAALVLAGSRPGAPDPVAVQEGVAHKSLVPIAGRTMLERVVTALRAAGIARVAVATNAAEVADLARQLGCEVLPAATGPSASVAGGLAALGAPLLVTTSDHALLRPEWVANFIAQTPAGADVSVLLARRDAIEAAAPGSRRTYLRFADGEWSGCNLFLIATARGEKAIDTWKLVEADRKRPWRIAARLGPGVLVGYVLGRISLATAIRRLGRRIGVDAALVAARDGLAAVDVDKPQDLADAKALLAREPVRSSASGS